MHAFLEYNPEFWCDRLKMDDVLRLQRLTLEMAKLETQLSYKHCSKSRCRRKSEITRWDFSDLVKETRYLDYMAKKALTPPSKKHGCTVFDFEDDYPQYRKITKPHRIDPKVKRKYRKKTIKNDTEHKRRIAPVVQQLVTPRAFELEFQKENSKIQKLDNNELYTPPPKKKTQPEYSPPGYIIRQIPSRTHTDRKPIRDLNLGTPPEAGIDDALDRFVDNIVDLGKWVE